MIRNETQKDAEMITLPTIGDRVEMVRKDGRSFVGTVDDVRTVDGKGTMVVLNMRGRYASVYVESCSEVSGNLSPESFEVLMYGFHNLDTGYRG